MKVGVKEKQRVGGGWSSTVTLDNGEVYRVTLRRGRPTGVHFGRWGYQWWAEVYHDSQSMYRDRTHKTVGVRTILKWAGITDNKGDD